MGLLHAQVVLSALLPASLGRFPLSSLSNFRQKRRGPRSLWYTVVDTPQTGLVWSCNTLAPLSTILQWLVQEPRGFEGFSKFTQLTRNNLEQAQ
jgi:hypothetical protein